MPGRYVETHQMTSSKIAKHLIFVHDNDDGDDDDDDDDDDIRV